MEDKKRAAVIGLGNIGKAVLEALCAAPDFQIAGVVRRDAHAGAHGFDIPVVSDISKLDAVDVAVLCTPTRSVPDLAEGILGQGIATVDSFDIHDDIWALKTRLDPVAKQCGTASVIAAGWDPGSDSIVRTLLEALAPSGITYTNFGPGMSMGHTVAVKAIEGVADALSMTIPTGNSVHRRMVYIELLPGADFEDTVKRIKADKYFAHDETHVTKVDSIAALKDVGHAVNLSRKGVSGLTHNQSFEFNMRINNPALTGQVLVCAARAALRVQPGCYTMPEIAPMDFLHGSREALIRKLV